MKSKTEATQGFTLLEVLIATGILAIAVLGLISVIVINMVQSKSAEETSLAVSAAEAAMARVRGSEFKSLTHAFSPSITNPDGTPADTFSVFGLAPSTNDPDGDGIVGKIVFFTDENATGDHESMVGLPMDLDGDGQTSTNNVAPDAQNGSYLMLPCMVRIDWEGRNGPRTLVFYSLLSGSDR